MERTFAMRAAWAVGIVLSLTAAALIGIGGCSGKGNGTSGPAGQGRVVLLMHDAPVDNFTEVWLTVESVTMIGAGTDDESSASSEIVLDQAVRLDLMALDSVSMILASADIEAGVYSKIRLHVSNPEFVRDDDSVFTGSDIHLVANGHVDVNAQGSGIVVQEDATTIVSLDLDAENSIEINQTGSGRYILRPQVFVDASLEATQQVVIEGATVISIDAGGGAVVVELPGSDTMLLVSITQETEVLTIGGLPLQIGALGVGATVNVRGTMNTETGSVTATQIAIAL